MKNEIEQDFIYSKLIGVIKLLLVMLVATNVFIVAGFLWYLSLPVEEEEIITYTQEADTEGEYSPITQDIK